MKEYERTPRTPECLNDKGETYFKLYCNYFLDRNYLTEDLVPDIETLAYLQQTRVQLQDDLNEEDSGSDLFQELNKIITQIRLLKDSLGIKVRSNEFHKPTKTKDEDTRKPVDVGTLKSKNF